MASTTKASKTNADYTPKGTKQEHCSICRHYIETHACERVQGTIAPGGWCRFFAKDRAAA